MLVGAVEEATIEAYGQQVPMGFPSSNGKALILQKDIAAIRVSSDRRGRPCLGLMERLARGSELQVCGEGFSKGTVKVRSGDQHYFVLRSSVVPGRDRNG
jgi:hypothetical protein